MHQLKIKKGFHLRIAGAPETTVTDVPEPGQVALLPEWIPHVKPRLLVGEGEIVKIGSPLFEDKRNPQVRFMSPGAGRISRIQLGPRRVVQAIVIDRLKPNEDQQRFDPISMTLLSGMPREKVVARILEAGLWWVFRELPFRDIPDPGRKPPLIMVALSTGEPFSASPAVYLQDRTEWLKIGLTALRRLADNNVFVLCDAAQPDAPRLLGDTVTHWVDGQYPADDPGTVLYHVKSSASDNRAWYIAGQDLLLLAQLLVEGRYPTERVVAVGGGAAPVRRHFRTRLGVPMAALLDNRPVEEDTRWIAGGLLRGFQSSRQGFMGLYETSLTMVPQGGAGEFLTLFNPGPRKPTYSRLFLSRLNPNPPVFDCNRGGEERACIACLHCADVCPVDILPHMAYKAILAEEPEEYLAHGLLDCVECGLCSYVCPSKIELTRTFATTKAAYARDRSA